jgi:hypothetical protein
VSPGGWQALALALTASCIAGLVVVAWRLGTLDGNGGHTHRNVRRRAAAPFADAADRTDPDGDAYVAELRGAGRLPYVPGEAHEPGAWDTSPAAVASLYAALQDWAVTPAPDEDDPDIDDTGRIPHAVGTWGKPAAAVADELAARYLT